MLSPRERCIRAIEHEDVDRIPLAFNARPEVVSQLMHKLSCRNFEELLKVLHVDERYAPGIALRGGYLPDNVEVKEGPYGPAYTVGYRGRFEVRRDIWGVESIWAPEHTYTYTFIKHPLQEISLDEYE